MYDVVIVGAGASGVFCSLYLKYNNPKLKILLLEKNDRLGKKILITGNGKCNLGNNYNNISNYNSDSNLNIYKDRINNNYIKYLNKFGILTKKDEFGRIYPYSNQALTVCKSFERALDNLNVNILYNYKVNSVIKENDIFIINNNIKSKNIVIATGGITYPKTGSTGDGYDILKSFNHEITKLYPSLINLITDYKYIKELKGVRTDASVSLSLDNNIISKEDGNLQFTDNSLSGICIFNLSRNVKKYLDNNRKVKLIVDFIPEYDTSLCDYIKSFKNYKVQEALCCIINNKIALAITKHLNLEGKCIKDITDDDIKNIYNKLKHMEFNIIDTGDISLSQVTSGGAKLDMFNENLESNKVRGLYAVGEVLDVDSRCGGFNLSWAFNSAIIAADNISKKTFTN